MSAAGGAETDRADTEVDVLVAGAGAAGMTVALVCAIEGLDVLLIEKSDQVGGTSATSAGTIWVPGTAQAREAGFPTPSKRHASILMP